MRIAEKEWKAALLFRTWSAVMRATGMTPVKATYNKLSDIEKNPFRVVAESRELPNIEDAWKNRRARQYESLKSQYKSVGLHPSAILGTGRGPKLRG